MSEDLNEKNNITKNGNNNNEVIDANEEYFFKNAINNQVIIKIIAKI